MNALPFLHRIAKARILLLLLVSGSAFCQTNSLTLASGSAAAGGAISLSVAFTAGTSAPAGLQWTLTYASSNVASVAVAPGAAITAAGKTLTCVNGTGSVVCLAAGMNSSAITSGPVATATFTLASSVSTPSVAVGLTNALGVLPSGDPVAVSGTGSAITVQGWQPTVTGLTCSPTSVVAPASSTCTVTLSAAAPSGGTGVTLSVNNAAVTVPASVTVAAGSSTGTFTASAATVTASQTVTITATVNGGSKAALVTVLPAGSVQPGLVSGYGFNEGTGTTVADVSGNANTGQIQGATWTSSGKYGKGLSFNGTSSYVDLGSPSSLQMTGSITLSAWIYATAHPYDDGQILARSTDTSGWQFKTSADTGLRTFGIAVSPDGTAHTQRYSKTVVALNTWYHVAGVYDANAKTLDIYVNGVLDNGTLIGTIPASQVVPALNALVGMRSGGYNFIGTIDEARIYNRALSAAEIQLDMNTPVGSSSTPSVTPTGLTCNPSSIASGANSTCTVTISQAAPTGGSSITLSDNSAVLTVPASVTVAAGSTSATFTAAAAAVTANQTVTITASAGGASVSSSVTIVAPVAPVVLSGIQCSPSSINSGATSACTVTISPAAPTGGASITLSDNSASLSVPASVTVAAGASSATFTATTTAVTANQAVTITASIGGVSVTASVTIVAPAVVSTLVCSPATVSSSATTSCTVTLSKAAPTGGSVVALSSNNAALAIAGSVTVAAGASAATFTATAASVTTNQTAVLTASLNGQSATTTVTISAATVISALQCNPATVNSGGSATCTVTLSQALSNGAAVAVSNNNAMLTVPPSVTVPAAANSASFLASCGSISTSQTAVITASLNGNSVTTSVALQPVTGAGAAYNFDEGTGLTISDASGNGNTGQITGATWTTGKTGSALSFSGNNSFVNLGNPASLQTTGSMSWSAWVYITGSPNDDGQIVARSTDTSGWQLKTSPDTGVRTFAVAVWGTGASAHTQRYSKTVVSSKKWYHVAGIYNASAQTLDIYVNGVLDNGVLVGTVPSSQVTPSVNTTIGMRSGGYYFKGKIDDLRVYTRPLSQAEVQGDMANPVVKLATAPVLTSTARPMAAPSSRQPQPDAAVWGTALSESPDHTSALTCAPRTINAGGHVTCELRTAGAATVQLAIGSSSEQVKVPAVVTTRDQQSSLTFQVDVDAAARQQSATITATLASGTVEDTILVVPSSSPILTVPGRQLVRFGSRVGFTVSGSDSADLPLQIAAAGLPDGAIFDPASGRFEWIPSAAQAGTHEIAFTATNSARQSSTARVLIDVDSGTPVLTPSGQFACSPGAIGSLAGRWLAPAGSAFSDPSGAVTELAGVKVNVNGQNVPMLFASATQVNFQCPALEPGTQLSISVETLAAATDPVTTVMRAAAPQIFSVDGSGRRQGSISFTPTSELAMPRNFRVPAHPAQPGDRISIWVTGVSADAAILVRLGDISAAAESVEPVSGYAGVYTVQLRVPASVNFGDAVPVQVQVTGPDGTPVRSNTVTAAIEAVRN